jgi:hypothetical protein
VQVKELQEHKSQQAEDTFLRAYPIGSVGRVSRYIIGFARPRKYSPMTRPELDFCLVVLGPAPGDGDNTTRDYPITQHNCWNTRKHTPLHVRYELSIKARS